MHVVNMLSKTLFCIILAGFPAALSCGFYLIYYFLTYSEAPHPFFAVIWGIPAAIAGFFGALYVIRKTNMTVVHIINVACLILVTIYLVYVYILTRLTLRTLEGAEHLSQVF